MPTEETRIKQALNRRDENIAAATELKYERNTFGPYAKVSTPDRLEYFGFVQVYVEVKQPGRGPTKGQAHRMKHVRKHGTPAIAVCGYEGHYDKKSDTQWGGLDNYYEQLLEIVQPSEVRAHVQRYAQDAQKMRLGLEKLLG